MTGIKNKAKYTKKSKSLWDHKDGLNYTPSDHELEKQWRKKQTYDPFNAINDKISKKEFPKINCETLIDILETFYEASSNDAYFNAAKALRESNFISGGVKTAALKMSEKRSAAWIAAFRMNELIGGGLKAHPAAKRAAAQFGVPAASFEAAIKSVKLAHQKLRRAIKSETLEKSDPKDFQDRKK